MKRPLIAGNWKMNGSRASAIVLLEALKRRIDAHAAIDWVVFPPFVYLEQTAILLQETPIQWGGQDCYIVEKGAFTGEISPAMLQDLGCQWLIVGHSERRTLFQETSDLIAEKYFAAQAQELIPILCIGETAEVRAAGQTEIVLKNQLAPLFRDERAQVVQEWVIAYEPVWAIGTGNHATNEQVHEIHSRLRGWIRAEFGDNIKIRLLYGGSVKPDNAQGLFQVPDVDGFLVGGASLEAETFVKIGQACIG